MNRKRRWIVAILLLSLLFSLSGCTGSNLPLPLQVLLLRAKVKTAMDPDHYSLTGKVNNAYAEGAKYLRQDQAVMDQLAAENPQLAEMADQLSTGCHFPVYDQTQTVYYATGESVLEDLMADLEQAEDFIFLEFFIVDYGNVLDRLLDIFQRKVREGVEIRLMYDGTDEVFRLRRDFPREMEELGIRCKVFCPLTPWTLGHAYMRDHRKIAVIDGKVAYTGGFNLADEYSNEIELYGYWKDAGLRLTGKGVDTFTRDFLAVWNLDEKEKQVKPYLNRWTAETDGYVIPYTDHPFDDWFVSRMIYLEMLRQAREHVYIMTPYLLPDSTMMQELCDAARRRVDVRIILPGMTDHYFTSIAGKTYMKKLLRAGVRFYYYNPGMIHSKCISVDGKMAVVGSANFDFRSLELNLECGAVIYQAGSVAGLELDFQKTFPECSEIKEENLWDSFLEHAAGLFARLFAKHM